MYRRVHSPCDDLLHIPVSAIVMAAIVLGEHLAVRHFVGLAFIGAGLAAIDGRWLAWRGNTEGNRPM